MNRFSISQLEQFSGIKAHTIRMWEQRYEALQPCRTEGNTRYYDGNQLRRLLNIVTLTEAGVKISKACRMDDVTLFSKVHENLLSQQDVNSIYVTYLNQFINASVQLDEKGFTETYNFCIKRFGIIGLYIHILMPLLQRLGVLWSTNELSPANEHFISNLLRQKMIASLDSLPVPEKKGIPWLLFTPQYELHEIGLIVSQLLFREKGIGTLYLGVNVPLEPILDIMGTSSFNILMFLTNTSLQEETVKYLCNISNHPNAKRFVVAGRKSVVEPLLGVQENKKIIPAYTIESLSTALINLTYNE